MDGEVEASIFQNDSQACVKPKSEQGIVKLSFKNHLMPGKYIISAGIFDQSRQFVDWVEHVESFHVETSFYDGRKYDYRLGKVSILGNWSSN